ncbi:MAG: hypothetical protein KDA80_09020 [Planctomycetaceae bacterium]|nr:hypothetical protein [Planctomycetaceae bacterium]
MAGFRCLSAMILLFVGGVGRDPAFAEPIRDTRLLQKVELNASATPYAEVFAQISEEFNIPIALHESFQKGHVRGEKVTWEISGITLQSALAFLIEDVAHAAWTVDQNGVAVMDQLVVQETQATRDYSIASLAPLISDPTAFKWTIMETTTGPWNELDGIGGTIDEVTPQYVRVTNDLSFHQELEEFFTMLNATIGGRRVAPSVIDNANARITAALQRPATGPRNELPLREMIETLTKNTRAPVVFLDEVWGVNTVDLTQNVTCPSGRMPLKSLLREILEPLELAVRVDHEMLLIVSKIEDEDEQFTHCFDVRKLVSPTFSVNDLIRQIQQAPGTGPWFEIDGIGGTISSLGPFVIVRNTAPSLEKIGELLNGR